MNHQLIYKDDAGNEMTVNVEWPDSANMVPPAEMQFGETTYTYVRTET